MNACMYVCMYACMRVHASVYVAQSDERLDAQDVPCQVSLFSNNLVLRHHFSWMRLQTYTHVQEQGVCVRTARLPSRVRH